MQGDIYRNCKQNCEDLAHISNIFYYILIFNFTTFFITRTIFTIFFQINIFRINCQMTQIPFMFFIIFKHFHPFTISTNIIIHIYFSYFYLNQGEILLSLYYNIAICIITNNNYLFLLETFTEQLQVFLTALLLEVFLQQEVVFS